MMDLSMIERVWAAREAGSVQRCHTLPHHGEYNNAMHCHGMVQLLLLLHPRPTIEMVTAITWHDAGERWVGDLPAPAKWYNEALAEAHHSAERRAQRLWGMATTALNDEEQSWLSGLDKLELLLWALEQEALGNRVATQVRVVVRNWFKEQDDQVPDKIRDLALEIQWERLPDSREEYSHHV